MSKLVGVMAIAMLLLPACSLQQNRASTDETEKANRERLIYQEKAEAKLRELDRQIESFKEKLKSEKSGEHGQPNPDLTDLEQKREIARRKLDQLRTSSREAWADLKVGIDGALDDLDTACKRAASHFQ